MERSSVPPSRSSEVVRIQRASKRRGTDGRDAGAVPARMANRNSPLSSAHAPSMGSPQQQTQAVTHLTARAPLLLQGISNTAATANSNSQSRPADANRGHVALRMPEPFMARLLGAEHASPDVVHYVPLTTIQEAMRDREPAGASATGLALHDALDEAHRRRIARAADELLRQWEALKAKGPPPLFPPAPGAQPAASLVLGSSADAADRMPALQASAATLRAIMNRENIFARLKPAILAWLREHVAAVQHAAGATAADPSKANEAAGEYLASMERAMDGRLVDMLQQPTLARIIDALQSTSVTPENTGR